MAIDDLLAGSTGRKKNRNDKQDDKEGHIVNYDKISFSAYPEDAEWFKDFRWHLTINEGLTRYKDIFAKAISVLKKQYPDVKPRPEHARDKEREQGRKRK